MNIDEEAAKAVYEKLRCAHLCQTNVWTQGYDDRDITADIAIIQDAIRRCVEAEREAMREVVRSEPEFPDDPPFPLKLQLEMMGPIEACRFAAQLTKKCILERMEAQAIRQRGGK